MEVNVQADEGHVWVCRACGKRSKNLSGTLALNSEWDESCMLNAILCYEEKLVFDDERTRVIHVNDGGVVQREED